MKRKSLTFRLAWMLTLVLLCLAGFALLGLLLFSPQRVLANLVGEQPVSIQSALRANYAADDRALVMAPIDMRLVEEAIRDQTAPRAGVIPPGGSAPVAGRLTSTLGTVNQRSATPTAPASKTPAATLQTVSPTKPVTLSPSAVLLSRTPTRLTFTAISGTAAARTRTPSPTRPSGTGQPPTQTPGQGTATLRTPTQTPVTPTKTPSPSATPTFGGYPPPPQPTLAYP